MSTYADYTTVNAVRSTYLGSTATGQDGLLLDLIRSTSREIERVCNREFYPTVQTRYYDTPRIRRDILLDADLLSLTTFTNGDGTVFTAAQYQLYPLNESPKFKLVVLNSSSTVLQNTSSGDYEGALSIAGVWGYHPDYSNAWQDTLATLAAAISSTSTTTFTCTTGKLYAGDLIQIDTEYMYVSAVTTATSDTITVVRGVNGSTAATHLISTAISRWTMYDIEMVARTAVAAYFRLRSNTLGDTIRIGTDSFSTPKDVLQWMGKRLAGLGVIRVGLG